MSGIHRLSGVLGKFVIREIEDPMSHLYDVDAFDHVFLLTDWVHGSAMSKWISSLHHGDMVFPDTILVNGIGRNTMHKVI